MLSPTGADELTDEAAPREGKASRTQPPPSSTTRRGVDDDPPSGGGGGNQLVRVTVNLTPRAYGALERSTDLTGDNRTDVINRALLVYALINELVEQGGGSLTVVNKDGEKERIHIV
ncbi:hypothetical protein GCM10010432_06760 [Catellatospora methionotrophica]